VAPLLLWSAEKEKLVQGAQANGIEVLAHDNISELQKRFPHAELLKLDIAGGYQDPKLLERRTPRERDILERSAERLAALVNEKEKKKGVKKIHFFITQERSFMGAIQKLSDDEVVIRLSVGLFDRIKNEDQLDFVLGHELEHLSSELPSNKRAVEVEVDIKSSLQRLVNIGKDPYEGVQALSNLPSDFFSQTHPKNSARKDALSIALALRRRQLGLEQDVPLPEARLKQDWVYETGKWLHSPDLKLDLMERLLRFFDVKKQEYKRVLMEDLKEIKAGKGDYVRMAEVTWLHGARPDNSYTRRVTSPMYDFLKSFPENFHSQWDLIKMQSDWVVEFDRLAQQAEREVLGRDFSPRSYGQFLGLKNYRYRGLFGPDTHLFPQELTLERALYWYSSAHQHLQEIDPKEIKAKAAAEESLRKATENLWEWNEKFDLRNNYQPSKDILLSNMDYRFEDIEERSIRELAEIDRAMHTANPDLGVWIKPESFEEVVGQLQRFSSIEAANFKKRPLDYLRRYEELLEAYIELWPKEGRDDPRSAFYFFYDFFREKDGMNTLINAALHQSEADSLVQLRSIFRRGLAQDPDSAIIVRVYEEDKDASKIAKTNPDLDFERKFAKKFFDEPTLKALMKARQDQVSKLALRNPQEAGFWAQRYLLDMNNFIAHGVFSAEDWQRFGGREWLTSISTALAKSLNPGSTAMRFHWTETPVRRYLLMAAPRLISSSFPAEDAPTFLRELSAALHSAKNTMSPLPQFEQEYFTNARTERAGFTEKHLLVLADEMGVSTSDYLEANKELSPFYKWTQNYGGRDWNYEAMKERASRRVNELDKLALNEKHFEDSLRARIQIVGLDHSFHDYSKGMFRDLDRAFLKVAQGLPSDYEKGVAFHELLKKYAIGWSPDRDYLLQGISAYFNEFRDWYQAKFTAHNPFDFYMGFYSGMPNASGGGYNDPTHPARYESSALRAISDHLKLHPELVTQDPVKSSKFFVHVLQQENKFDFDAYFERLFPKGEAPNPKVLDIWMNERVVSNLTQPENQKRLALMQLERLFSLEAEAAKLRQDPTKIPRNEVRRLVRNLQDRIDKQFPENTGVKNRVVEEVSRKVMTNSAETDLLASSKLSLDNWAKNRYLAFIDAPQWVFEQYSGSDHQWMNLRYILGVDDEKKRYLESLPKDQQFSTTERELKIVVLDRIRSALPSLDPLSRTHLIMPFVSETGGLFREAWSREAAIKLILGKHHKTPVIKRLFETYLEILDPSERQVLLGHIMGSLTEKGMSSLGRVFEAMGPLGVRAAQFLRSSGLVDAATRQELDGFFDNALPVERDQIMKDLEEAFGKNFLLDSHVMDRLGSGSMNYVVEARVLDPQTNRWEEVVVRIQRGESGGQVRNENQNWEKLVQKLSQGSESDKRLAQKIDFVRRQAVSTIQEGGVERDLSIERKIQPLVKAIYEKPAPSKSAYAVKVAQVSNVGQSLVRPEKSSTVSVYKKIPGVSIKALKDAKLQEDLASQIVDSELEAILIKGHFDPDGHPGNWLIDTKAKVLTRLDYAQFVKEPIPSHELETIRDVLKGLSSPALSSEERSKLAGQMEKLFDVPDDITLRPSFFERLLEARDFPSYRDPLERIFYIQREFEKGLEKVTGKLIPVYLNNNPSKVITALAKLRIYAEYSSDPNFYAKAILKKLGSSMNEMALKASRAWFKDALSSPLDFCRRFLESLRRR
jgi:hypothetical protein